jgi:hypothetical protein
MNKATLGAINSSRIMFETPVVEQDGPRFGSPKDYPSSFAHPCFDRDISLRLGHCRE